MDQPRRLSIRDLFALLGVAVTDEEFWSARPRKRKTRRPLEQARDVAHRRRRPKLTRARLVAYHRAKDQAERETKKAMIQERQIEKERRRAA